MGCKYDLLGRAGQELARWALTMWDVNFHKEETQVADGKVEH